jgi:hypothetical protein
MEVISTITHLFDRQKVASAKMKLTLHHVLVRKIGLLTIYDSGTTNFSDIYQYKIYTLANLPYTSGKI